ncbi:unnamed protein product [Phyllotreta striolata]|uniref:AB hydrolase-1 domain-containing protein n=1 Tax=Phyllotreta striolata TaxID=444603 RepID=A0A9N9TLR3_PHYSR|nr:unnamed protein product [Phyllotreta striolata]
MLYSSRITKIAQTKYIRSVRWVSTKKREYKEIEIKVPWGHVAGKWWEPYETRPILSIHGWQDNCGTFDRLIPMLDKNVGFLAIDLPGHGYSSRLSEGNMYHLSTYMLTIKSVAKELKWPTISLLGHSLGAVVSNVYSMFFPLEIDFLMCLDALKPMVPNNRHLLIAKAYELFFKYNSQAFCSNEPPSYTLEEMIDLVAKPNRYSVLPEYTGYILDRNIAPSTINPEKYYFTRDPRLKTGSLALFCQEELEKLSEHIVMPIFILKASESSYYEEKNNYYRVLEVIKKSSTDCDFNYVEGSHHVHLNNPERISGLINNFICRNNTQERCVGGLSDELVRDFRISYAEKLLKN